MATYLGLVKFTEQGTKGIKNTCKRAADFQASAKKLGGDIKEIYWSLGAYDGVMVFEAGDDETATAVMLSLSVLGNVKTETLRLFSSAEMTKILAKLP
jgi:uncharacterized protein with GYD domain